MNTIAAKFLPGDHILNENSETLAIIVSITQMSDGYIAVEYTNGHHGLFRPTDIRKIGRMTAET